MSQDKAQLAVNGHSLNKGCNAVLTHLWTSLWARRAVAIRGVASLVKGTPFPARCVSLIRTPYSLHHTGHFLPNLEL